MAGLHSSFRPSSSSSLSSSSSSHIITSRLLLLLTLLPFTLACFAFVLQWRGGVNDPITRWSPDLHQFPGMESSDSLSRTSRSSGSDCVDPLSRRNSPSFPYYRDWKFDYGSDLRPKVRFLFLLCYWISFSLKVLVLLGMNIFAFNFMGFIHFLIEFNWPFFFFFFFGACVGSQVLGIWICYMVLCCIQILMFDV